jgi:hypothetical protein
VRRDVAGISNQSTETRSLRQPLKSTVSRSLITGAKNSG